MEPALNTEHRTQGMLVYDMLPLKSSQEGCVNFRGGNHDSETSKSVRMIVPSAAHLFGTDRMASEHVQCHGHVQLSISLSYFRGRYM